MTTQKTAAILVIGDEILSGRTKEANAHHLARILVEKGVDLKEIRVVPDDHDVIVNAVRSLSAAHDYVFTSGGIGPTHDDITADAVAAAFGASIAVRDDARKILRDYYGEEMLNEARLRMARIPEGATLIDNPVSRAPGFQLRNTFVLPGVPAIFREMVAGIQDLFVGGSLVLAWSFRGPFLEGDIANVLQEISARNQHLSIGCYPFYRGGIGATVVLRSRDAGLLRRAAGDMSIALRAFSQEIQETPPDLGARGGR